MTISRFKIPALCCPAESAPLERALHEVPGVTDVRFDYPAKSVAVTHEGAKPRALAAAAAGAGFAAEALDAGPRRLVLSVPEMDCPVEAGAIEREFARAGITGAAMNTMARTVTLAGDDALAEAAVAAVARAGFTATVLAARAPAPATPEIPWIRLGFALLLAFAAEALDLILEYLPQTLQAGPGGAEFSAELCRGAMIMLSVAAVALAGTSTFRNALNALRVRTLNMNVLTAFAVIGAVLLGAWPEAAMVTVLFEISEAIEQLSLARAQRSIRDLMKSAPETAFVKQADGTFAETPTAETGPGAVIRVHPGDRVPLDGKVLTGTTSVDQSAVSGESVPADKVPGDPVWAGTVNLTGTVDVRVTADAADSLVSRIIDAVENAQAAKSPVQRFVDRFAAVYAPLVFAIALFTAFAVPLFAGDWGTWIYRALCLLVIACPCALVISTPVTIVSALAAATRCGLLVKGGLYLEQARHLKNVALDKTGTLTKGEPELRETVFFDAFDETAVKQAGASLAAMNRHPLSQALVHDARAQNLTLLPVTDFRSEAGTGVEGRVNGALVRLVNLKRLEALGLATDELRTLFAEAAAQGCSAVAQADCFGVTAFYRLEDALKPDSADGIAQLRAVGLTPCLLTGDRRAAADALCTQLGITDVKAELLPEEKLAEIGHLQQSGLTAMAGDGINDAPALAKADIGIAMGLHGTDSAIEAAHVVVMDDSIGSVASLVRLSRMTHRVLLQNIVFAIGVKVICALMALSGHATMWMAIFADVGTCLIVVANGLRMMKAAPAVEKAAAAVRAAASECEGCAVR